MKSSCNRRININNLSTDNGQRTTDIKIEGHNRVKNPKQFIGRTVLILACIGIVAFSLSAASADAPKRIALLPFKINSDKDLSFLQDGIFDMLTTRLSKEGQVDVIGRTQTEEAIQAAAPSGAINESVARGIGTRLNADFVLFGSLTVLGNNVSIDAKMVDVSGGRPTMTFFDQGQDLGAVITKINLIAADINEKVFGETKVAAAAETPGAVKKSPSVAQQPAPKSDIYAHPEKVLEEDGFVAHEKAGNLETQGYLKGTAQETQSRFWKSANFKNLIYGVTLGDVDGDGKIETVAATPHSVIIFRSENGAFRKIAEIEESSSKNLIGIDCADINENGVAEIFVTSLNAERTVVSSYILEYDGSNFVKIIKATPYYFRVAATPHRGKILLGQRPRTGKPSAGGIFEMKWQNGEYVPTDPINVPIDTNLLGLTIGDAENDGQEVAVAYKDGDYIQIIDPATPSGTTGNGSAAACSTPAFPGTIGVRLKTSGTTPCGWWCGTTRPKRKM